MEVKIEVTDEQFQRIVKESIESLPQEKLHEVVLSAIKEYLTTKDVLDSLLTYKSGYYSNDRSPSAFLEKLMNRAETTDAVNDIRDEMLKLLKENNKEILITAFMRIFLHNIFNTSEFNSYASMAASEVMMAHISESHNN